MVNSLLLLPKTTTRVQGPSHRDIDEYLSRLNVDIKKEHRWFGSIRRRRQLLKDGNRVAGNRSFVSEIKGEIGCFLAHLRAINLAYRAGHEFAVILEDDSSLELVPQWRQPLEEIIRALPVGWDHYQLSLHASLTTFRKVFSVWEAQKRPIYIPTAQFMDEPWINFHGTGAYAISRKGMKKIVDRFPMEGPRPVQPCFASNRLGKGWDVTADLCLLSDLEEGAYFPSQWNCKAWTDKNENCARASNKRHEKKLRHHAKIGQHWAKYLATPLLFVDSYYGLEYSYINSPTSTTRKGLDYHRKSSILSTVWTYYKYNNHARMFTSPELQLGFVLRTDKYARHLLQGYNLTRQMAHSHYHSRSQRTPKRISGTEGKPKPRLPIAIENSAIVPILGNTYNWNEAQIGKVKKKKKKKKKKKSKVRE
jgi:GR25 family glycosyltransferase involved in LPS biosynthesis